jgi:hypothetical protein
MPGMDGMPGDDRHSAAARRDDGVRQVTRITWRAGAAGVIGSALIAVAFGHHVQASPASPGTSGGQGGIVVPGAPPAPAAGGGHVVSGAS